VKQLAALVIVGLAVAACGGGTTPIEEAVEACVYGSGEIEGVRIADEGQSLLINGQGEDEITGANIFDTFCLLNEIELPDSVISRMDSTSSLSGQQEATWNDYTAYWTYHPDNGLDIIIETNAD